MNKIVLLMMLSLLFACSSLSERDYSAMQQSELSGPVVSNITSKGMVIDVLANKHILFIRHGPIPEMNWPPMLMKFKVEKSVSLTNFKKGDRVFFDMEIDAQKNYRVSDVRMQ